MSAPLWSPSAPTCPALPSRPLLPDPPPLQGLLDPASVPLPWLSLDTLSMAPGETLLQSEQVLARPYCPDLKGGLPLRKPLIPGCCWGCLSHHCGLVSLPPRCLMVWFLWEYLPTPPLTPPGWDLAQTGSPPPWGELC